MERGEGEGEEVRVGKILEFLEDVLKLKVGVAWGLKWCA